MLKRVNKPILILFLFFILSILTGCKEEIRTPEEVNYKTPTIVGSVSIPSTAQLSASELWIKASSEKSTVFVGRISADSSFFYYRLR